MLIPAFKDVAARGKILVGWFFGLKSHLVIKDKGELLNAVVVNFFQLAEPSFGH
jgi:Transposase DDE domain